MPHLTWTLRLGKEQSRALEPGISVKSRGTYTVGVYGCGFANGELNLTA